MSSKVRILPPPPYFETVATYSEALAREAFLKSSQGRTWPARRQTVLPQAGCLGPWGWLAIVAILLLRGGMPLAANAADGMPIVVEIVQRSMLPDPRTSPYKDCLYAAELRLIPSGETQLPPRLLGIFPGFIDYRLAPAAAYQAGDRLRTTLRPFEEMSEEYRSLQQVDEIADLSLPCYAVVESQREESNRMPAAVLPPEMPIEDFTARAEDFPRAPAFPEMAARRAADIQADLARWREKLAGHGNDWDKWHADLAPVRAELGALAEAAGGAPLVQGRLTLDPGDPDLVWRLDPARQEYRSFLEAMMVMQREFTALGTDLLVVPFPSGDQIAAPAFLRRIPPDGVLQPDRARWIMDLLERGIEVLDLLPLFQERAPPYPFFYHSDVGDEHPALGALQEAAAALAGRLGRYRFAGARHAFGRREAYYGDANRPALIETRERYPCRQILDEAGNPLELPEESPVLLIGDSFLDTPQRYGCPHANLPHQLAYELGVAPSVFLRTGGAHEILKFMARWGRLAQFANRRVAIFVFNERLLYKPDVAWAPTPFRESARAKEMAMRRFEAGTPVWHLFGPYKLRQLEVDPPLPPENWLPGKVVLPSFPAPRTVALPQVPADSGSAALVRLNVVSTGSGRVAVAMDEAPAGEFPLEEGKQAYYVALPLKPGPVRLGFRFPPNTPNVALTEVELRTEPARALPAAATTVPP